jgi:hypothetical protein
MNISEELSHEVRRSVNHLAKWEAWDFRPEGNALVGYGEMDDPNPEEGLDWLARHVWEVTTDYRLVLLSVRPGTPEVQIYAADEEEYQEYLAVDEELAREREAEEGEC